MEQFSREQQSGSVPEVCLPASPEEDEVESLLFVFVQQVVLYRPGRRPGAVKQLGAALTEGSCASVDLTETVPVTEPHLSVHIA